MKERGAEVNATGIATCYSEPVTKPLPPEFPEDLGRFHLPPEPAPASPTAAPPSAVWPYAPPAAALVPSPAQLISYASFGARLFALVVDLIFLFTAFFVVVFVALATIGEETLDQIWYLLFYGLGWIYFAGFESSAWRGTPGKRMLSLRVTDLHGQRIGFVRATGRYFGRCLSMAILSIGFLIMLGDDRRQTLHDKMAGCLVLKQR